MSIHSFRPAEFREVNSRNEGFGDAFPNIYKNVDMAVATRTVNRSVAYVPSVIKFYAGDSEIPFTC
jgi:hypothetical protein